MKIWIFIMKYIDHTPGSSKKTVFEVTVRCPEEPQWKAGDGNKCTDDHAKWIAEHAKWECELHEEVRKQLTTKHPELNLGEYQLHSIKKEKKGDMININHGTKNNTIEFRKVFWMECTVCECTKGDWPSGAHIGDILKYTKKYYTHEWLLGSKVNILPIALNETSCKHEFDVKPEGSVGSTGSTGSVTSTAQPVKMPQMPLMPSMFQMPKMPSMTQSAPESKAPESKAPESMPAAISLSGGDPQNLSEQKKLIAKQQMDNWRKESKNTMPMNLDGPATEAAPNKQLYKGRMY